MLRHRLILDYSARLEGRTTDGVIEAPNSAGEQFGERALLNVLREAGSDTLMDLKAAVLGAIRKHTGGSLAHDDVTLMAVEIR